MMTSNATHKYKPYPTIKLTDRTWPDAVITRPPVWCSVDLRDGNQALIDPMGPEKKLQMWDMLVHMGFKEIEVGFPAASQTDYDFIRFLIDSKRIPDNVTIQVLTQSRDELIHRTFEAVEGAAKVVVHLYNSTSELQRRVVFGFDRDACVELACSGTRLVRRLADQRDGIVFQYSPESYTGTEPDFAVEIVEKVAQAWGAAPGRKMIVNLPATVEMSTPNVYADMIEWFARTIKGRENLILSVHPHNDRGTGVAAAELAIMAGADRVEGTLFGNGERTGNVDLITLALNMFTQGTDPGLKCSDIQAIRDMSEDCTQIAVHPRHPYAGDLVFTAFSGSHQDAIHKGLAALKKANSETWEVPYLPIDPADLGRSYEAVIRVNSQSGKGGVAHVLERDYGLKLPRKLQVEFSGVVQAIAETESRELKSAEIMAAFEAAYWSPGKLALEDYRTIPERRDGKEMRHLTATIAIDGKTQTIEGDGNGPVDAFAHALEKSLGITVRVKDYVEHAIGQGSEAMAAAYVEVENPKGGTVYGAARHPSIVMASLLAVISAVNRLGG